MDLSDTYPLDLRLYQVFGNDSTTLPWHLYQSPEEVDHLIQHHMLDFADPDLFNEDAMALVNSEFERLANGWATTEEEARDAGIPVTHGCRFQSNSPCEDFFALGSAPAVGPKNWGFWAVYDGHAGRFTANYLQWALIPHVSRGLSGLSALSEAGAINQSIQQTFVRVDDEMMNRAKHAGNWYPAGSGAAITALGPAFAGSCALLSMFDPEKKKLRVACVGDSRAVLGRWDPAEQKYTCQALSKDQTGFNEDEVSRVNAEHPDEEGLFDPETGRLLGIAITRAFGDHRWKWDSDIITQCKYKFFGSRPRPNSKTPPYMTAEPVITETDVVSVDAGGKQRGERSDFMIMASDGLWDRISSEHAVLLVEQWLASRARGNGSVHEDPLKSPVRFPPKLQADPSVTYSIEEDEMLDWKATPEYFSIEDDNAAVCLARNAMGGTRKGLFMGLLSIASPYSREAVDDTTVMVVFFDKLGEGKEEGKGEAKAKRRWWFW